MDEPRLLILSYKVHDQIEKITPLTLAPHGHGEKNYPHAPRARVKTLTH